jgi:hypothetical protein
VPEPTRKAGQLVLQAVDTAVERRWEHAVLVATEVVGPVDERVARITRAYVREMSAVGAAAGAAAAVPGTGAIALLGTAAIELGWFAARTGDLILAIAAAHGHTSASVEQRRAWVLSLLAFGDAAPAGFTRLAGDVGKGLGRRATERIPAETLRTINRALGRTVVTKYGTKRGAVALGRALPFGIGAAVGGGANYAFARAIAHQADRFFRDLPPALRSLPS